MVAAEKREVLSPFLTELAGPVSGEKLCYLATLVEYVRGIESRRHSAKRPIIFFVTLLVGASSSGIKGARSSKYLLRRSRRCNRTSPSRAFTAAWLRFSAC